VLATVFGIELSAMIISTHDPYWRRRGDRLAASKPHLSVISRLITGFHDCKWYCESLSLINRTDGVASSAMPMNWCIRAGRPATRRTRAA
jgi:hypothetical protein